MSADRDAMVATALAVLREVDAPPLGVTLQPNPGISLSQRKVSRTEGSIRPLGDLLPHTRLPFGQKRVSRERRLSPTALSSKETARRRRQVGAYPGVELRKEAPQELDANSFSYRSLA
ncbi:hypothetical protein MSC49_21090 [Methylosinus sp. C49]|nr:hypothetical protein MSC49_21090 [Methylosinus sp. C49]